MRLREERKRLGLTQDAFGAAGGVQKGAVIKYEKGERTPDATFLAGIAAAGADLLYIVTGTPTPRGASTCSQQELVLLESYAKADDAGRAVLEGVAVLAARVAGAPAIGSVTGKGNSVTIGGDVGQSIAGDQTNTGPISFSVGKRGKS